ncbi:MAG: queuosine precursor transporter, partial [Sulfuritalea sp.]|nr:queuosine precursor transporter [Sulfuritalea sp.]
AHMEGVFGNTWRIVAGSMIAFWCGSFANSYVMAKMKVWMQGRRLWMRTIGSTMVGEAVDSGLFYVIAFYGIWPDGQVAKIALAQYLLKTGWEVVMTPLTYRIVAFLKRAEEEDWYDRNTDFSPFHIRV